MDEKLHSNPVFSLSIDHSYKFTKKIGVYTRKSAQCTRRPPLSACLAWLMLMLMPPHPFADDVPVPVVTAIEPRVLRYDEECVVALEGKRFEGAYEVRIGDVACAVVASEPGKLRIIVAARRPPADASLSFEHLDVVVMARHPELPEGLTGASAVKLSFVRPGSEPPELQNNELPRYLLNKKNKARVRSASYALVAAAMYAADALAPRCTAGSHHSLVPHRVRRP